MRRSAAVAATIAAAMTLLSLSLVGPLSAGAATAAAGLGQPYKVGFTVREFVPPEPYDWRGSAHHRLLTMIWYPAAADAHEKPQQFPPNGNPILDGGNTAPGAPLAPTPAKFPLVMLSHGTGGTSANMAWLASALAARGYVAAAVNHPGNNAIDGYTVQGFTLGWLRARDISAGIDAMFADKMFAGRLDRHRIAGAGHSFGGYTMIELAGGISSVPHFLAFCQSPAADALCQPLPEFPDRREKAEALLKTDPAFKAAYDDYGRSYRDERIRAVFVMAPALGPLFTPEALAAIHIPVAIVAGASDAIVPIASSARYFAAHIPHAELTILPAPAGHYVFIGNCLARGRKVLPLGCIDAPGVDRASVLNETASLAEKFFAAHLQ
jgi:predicted dienelactone hydrolase